MRDPGLARDRQAAFRVVLDCIARPGRLGRIAAPAGRTPLEMILEALVVNTDVLWMSVDPPHGLDLVSLLQATGARRGELPNASLLAAGGEVLAPAIIGARRGSLEYPDEGATIVGILDRVAETSGAAGLISLEVRGPGVPGARQFAASGLAEEAIGALAEANKAFPLGVDLILLDHGGAVVGLPRSCCVGIIRNGGH